MYCFQNTFFGEVNVLSNDSPCSALFEICSRCVCFEQIPFCFLHFTHFSPFPTQRETASTKEGFYQVP